jgi:NitT/TauT family transport system substrate-binding protein
MLGASASAVPLRLRAQTTKIRVAYTTSDAGIEPVYGQAQGIFAKAGLDVELQPYGAGLLMIESIAAGVLDIALTDPMQLANAVLRGIPLGIFAGGASYSFKTPPTLMCVAKNSPVRGAKDLEGQTVGTNSLNGGVTLGIRAWLDQNGVDNAKVKIFEVPFSEMGAALERGTVVAAVMNEPFLTYAGTAVRGIGRPMEIYGKTYTNTFWYTSRTWASRNSDLLRRWTAAIYETARWANAHQAESLQILVGAAKLEIDRVRTMKRYQFATSFSSRDLLPVLDLALKYRFISRPVPVSDLVLA